jgi:hypothetical protein
VTHYAVAYPGTLNVVERESIIHMPTERKQHEAIVVEAYSQDKGLFSAREVLCAERGAWLTLSPLEPALPADSRCRFAGLLAQKSRCE